jgi:hypothetical protein
MLLAAAQKILNLTDAQVQQLAQLRTAFQTNVQGLRTNLRTLQQQLSTVLNSANPDPAQLGNLALQRKALEQQLATATTSYHDQALAVLTQAQRDQLAQIQAAVKVAMQAIPLAPLGLIDIQQLGGALMGGPLGGALQMLRGMGPGFMEQGLSGPGPRRGGPPPAQ